MASQFDLFSANPPAPDAVPGFTLMPEAIPPALEAELAAHIDAAPLIPFRYRQWEGKRLTASYGQGYDFERNRPAPAPPLPAWLAALRARLAPLAGLDPAAIVQALVIRYDPGAGIGWHRDRPQYGHVLGLSLTAACSLRLRRRLPDGKFERRTIALPPRSLYRLSGEARHLWQHSIAPLEMVRRSITLRTGA